MGGWVEGMEGGKLEEAAYVDSSYSPYAAATAAVAAAVVAVLAASCYYLPSIIIIPSSTSLLLPTSLPLSLPARA